MRQTSDNQHCGKTLFIVNTTGRPFARALCILRHRSSLIVLFALTAILFGHQNVAVSGDLYRWVDEDGVSHYSDEPPSTALPNGNNSRVKTIKQPSSYSKGPQEFIIPFEHIGEGMMVDVIINNYIPARMLVDTGATATKINLKLLKQLNQDIPENRRRGYAMTAGGVIKAEELFIDKIDVGGAVKENVRTVFLPGSRDDVYFDGLLGMSFLSDFKMTVDYKNSQIHLRR